MIKKNTLGSGLLILVIAGVVGYGIGLGLETLVTGSPKFDGAVPSAFTILLAVSAFFFGLYGYRGITRGLVWQVLGTLAGALFVTAIRFLMGSRGTDLFGTFFFSEPAWVFGGLAVVSPSFPV